MPNQHEATNHVAFMQPFVTHLRMRRTGCIRDSRDLAMSSYSVSEAALDKRPDSLRDELRPLVMRVYNLLPGTFRLHHTHRGRRSARNPQRTSTLPTH